MSGIHPVPNFDRPAIPPRLPPLEEDGSGDDVASAAESLPVSVPSRVMEYVSHALFIVVALIVMDWLHHNKPPSVQIGYHSDSIRGDRPFQDIRILEKLKRTFL